MLSTFKNIKILGFMVLLMVCFGGCKLEETPNENRYFQAVVDVNGGDVKPLHGFWRTDGKIYVLFLQDGILTSAVLSTDLATKDIRTYPQLSGLSGISQDQTPDDGFIIIAGNRVIKIGADQGIKFDEPITLGDNTEFEAVKSSNNTFLIAGTSEKSAPYEVFPSVLKLSLDGIVLDSKVYNRSHSAIFTKFFRPYDIVQVDGDDYSMLGFRAVDTPAINLLTAFSNGNTRGAIIPGFPYAINSIGSKLIITSITSVNLDTVTIFTTDELGTIESSSNIYTKNLDGSPDKQLINTIGDEIVFARNISNDSIEFNGYRINTGNLTPKFSKRFGQKNGKINVVSIANHPSGYFLTVLFEDSLGQKRLYLIKTDENGNTE